MIFKTFQILNFLNPKQPAELMSRLESDPEWVRLDEEGEARHKARMAQLQPELKPEEETAFG